MNKLFLSIALAVLAFGHTSILGARCPQTQSALKAERNLSEGNTAVSQTQNQDANIAGPGSVRVVADDLVGWVTAMAMTKLDRASNGIIAS